MVESWLPESELEIAALQTESAQEDGLKGEVCELRISIFE